MHQVAGLSQLAGELMLVSPQVIDLGWGELKSALVKLKDADFIAASDADVTRRTLMGEYVTAFRQQEAGDPAKAGTTLQHLAAGIGGAVAPEPRAKLASLIDAQRAKLA